MSRIRESYDKGTSFERVVALTLMEECKNKNWLLAEDLVLESTSMRGYSQIDCVLFTPYRYFCIEVKNWDCKVICSYDTYWSIEYDRNFRTLSPYHQNEGHINRLSGYIEPYKLQNVVCFGEDTKLINQIENVYKFSDFLLFLKSLTNCKKVISLESMQKDYITVLQASMRTKFMQIEGKQ